MYLTVVVVWKRQNLFIDVFHTVTIFFFGRVWLKSLLQLFNLILLLLFTEPEYLPKPSEASVWNSAASVWNLHHCHWSRPLFQVRNVWSLLMILKDLKTKDLTAFSSFRKRTMFQKLVETVEGIPEEKEKVNFISNNPTRKEIIM